MTQYIDKDALVAEIERYKHKADERLKIKGRTLAEDCKDSALQNLCGNLLHFIDTLEVKGVVDAEIVEVEDDNNSIYVYTHLEICTEEDLSKICKAGDKAKVIIIKQK